MSVPARSPLRVGVVLDGLRAPAWAAWVVEAIRRHGDLELALAVVCDGYRSERRGALVSLYEALDRRVFRRAPDALEPVDLSGTLDGVAHVRASVAAGGPDGRPLAGEDVAAVRRPALDVLLHLAAVRPRGEILPAAEHGIWSLHHGDPVRYRGEPALFWELFFGDPASTSVLEIHADDPGADQVIYRSVTATDPISLERTRNPSHWKAARFPLRRLEDLARGRWKPEPPGAGARVPAARAAPSNADAVRLVARISSRYVRRRLRSVAAKRQWFLGFRRRRPGLLPSQDEAQWQVCLPPTDRYWADPFVVEGDGETLVFVEELRFARGMGELAVGRLDAGGGLTPVEPVLARPHHLSYPYVLRDGGRTFMVPESAQARRVELWTATEFPLRWELVGPLLEDVQAVDASILRHDDLYWMWVNVAVPGARLDDETFLYFSDRLESGWTPHPRNPVVSDARRARPAGRPFLHGGRLIRPAQDCTRLYGGRVVFNEVELLTPEDYRERPVASLGPEWASPGSNLCAHTYTFDGAWEATDGLRRVRRRPRRPGRRPTPR